MKALEKDRSRRYGTCGDLADDVERFLKDEPIEARPPSASYKFSKLLRRHPEAVMVAMSFVAMMILTTWISVWLALKAATAEEDSLQAIADMEIALRRSKRMEQQSRVSAKKARLESMEGSMAVEVFREVLINLIRRQAEVVVRGSIPAKARIGRYMVGHHAETVARTRSNARTGQATESHNRCQCSLSQCGRQTCNA